MSAINRVIPMKIRATSLLLSLPLTALLTACAGSGTSEQQVAAQAEAAPNEVTCKNVVKTGTRIGTRVCKTNQAWEDERRTSREATEAIQRGGAQTQTLVGG
jgi:hypothetical protein